MAIPVDYKDHNVELVVQAIMNWSDKGISPQFIYQRIQAIADEYLYETIHSDK